MKKILHLIAFIALAITTKAQVTFTVTTPPCNSDGVLTANFSGLTPPLTVVWNIYDIAGSPITHTGVTGLTDILTSYSGGPLGVTVTDAFGTIDWGHYTGAPPFTYSVTTTPGYCPAPGAATATVTGGTSPYTYQWLTYPGMSVASTANPTSLAAGGYLLRITDAAGCVFGSEWVAWDTINIYSIPPFTFSASSTDANCTNGTATTGPITGSSGPFSYLWSNGATTSSITGLVTDVYTVTVTDGTGCTGGGSVYVNQVVAIGAPITATPATCTATDGAAIVFPTGGVVPYTYLWSNSVTLHSQSGMPPGSYNVTVTDANGCIGKGWTTIGTSTPITVTYSTTASLCTSATGTASVVPTGGTGPYTYQWNTFPVQTTATATALAPGNHNFKVTDATGCVQTGTVIVPPVNLITAIVATTPALCTLATGSASVIPSGGSGTYTYSWTSGATTSSISGKPKGTYTVTITDAMGCKLTTNAYITNTSPVSLGASTTPSSCIFTNDGSITATATGGTTPYSYSWSTGGTTSTISSLLTGRYWAYVTDAAGCTASHHLLLGYNTTATSCYCTISGKVYHDANNNCVQDAGEAGIPNIQILCSGIGYTYTDASGDYAFKVPTGSYTISETVRSFYPLSTCQTNYIPVSVTASSGCVHTVNFANTINPIHDIHISIWNSNLPVPGNTYNQHMLISNEGTVTETSILAGYKPDGQLFAPTFAPGTIFSGSPYWYNTAAGFPTLAPGTTQAFLNSYSVPTTIPMGTNVVFKDTCAYTAPMNNWLTDYSPANNLDYLTTTVVSSYDPNFKEVSPKGTGPAGTISYDDSVLEYMVHFQNLGTWQAQNVVVIDTLDNNLEWTSLRPIYQSAQCNIALTQVGTYRIATFTFNNINLPPAMYEPIASNGLFTYTIKTKPGLPLGTTFRNSASIYFDYNEPVKTNTTLNTIGVVTKINNITPDEYHSFTIYPNPAGSTFSALINSDYETPATMAISDITGKTLLSKNLSLQKGQQTIATDISQLTPGIYFVTMNANGKTETSKLVVMR